MSSLLSTQRRAAEAARSAVAGTAGATVVIFALVTAALAFVAVAMPRYDVAFRTHALEQRLVQADPDSTSMVAASQESLDAGVQPDAVFDPIAALMHDILVQRLPMAPATADWYSVETAGEYVADAPPKAVLGTGPFVALAYRSDLDRHVRVVAGAMPTGAPPVTAAGQQVARVIVPQSIAMRLGLRVGMLMHADGDIGSAALQVAAIVAPTDPAAPYWTEDPGLTTPTFVPAAGKTPAHWDAAFYVDAKAMRVALGTEQDAPSVEVFLRWVMPLTLAGIDADHIRPVVAHAAAVVQERTLAQPDPETFGAQPYLLSDVAVSSGLPDFLGPWLDAQSSIVAALSLLLAGMATIGAVMVLVAGRLVVTRRGQELTLYRARGQSLRQLVARIAGGAAVLALPGVAVGAALGRALTPGPPTTLAWWFAGATAVVGVAGPAAIGVGLHRTARPDGTSRERAASSAGRYARWRRWVVEASLVVAAVAGLMVLRQQQPLGGSASIDPFAAAAPALIAVPPAVLAPYGSVLAIRLARRGMSRRKGVAVFLGLAQASRPRPGTATAIFALVLTLGIVSFGPMLRDAVSRGGVAASWAALGADAVVDVSGVDVSGPDISGDTASSGAGLTPATQHSLIAASRATASVTADATRATFPQTLPTDSFAASAVDPVAYAALLTGTPAPALPPEFAARPQTGEPVPVVTSPRLGAELGDSPVALSLSGAAPLTVQVVGIMIASAVAPGATDFVLIPAWAIHQPLTPNVLALRGAALDDSALTAAAKHVRGARVSLRSAALGNLPGSSLQSGAYRMLAAGSAAAALFSVLILLLTLSLDARAREAALTRLRCLGLDGRRTRAMTFAETLPMLLMAALGGVVATASVAPIVGPRLDLSLFTGSPVSVPLRAGAVLVALPAVGLVAAALATLLAYTALSRRRGLARALRTGDW